MSMDYFCPALPKAPPSANLPKKPDPCSTPLDSAEGSSSEPSDPSKNPPMNMQDKTPAQRPDNPRTPPTLPGLSSTTKDILARVQNARSTPAGQGPPVGYFRDTYPIAGLLPSSIRSGSGNQTGLLSSTSTSSYPVTSANLSVQNDSPSETSKVSSDGGTMISGPYREILDHPDKVKTSISFKLASQIPYDPNPISSETTIQVASTVDSQGSMMPTPTSAKPTPPSSSRRRREYVLPDGRITTGKGLGRGRPGIKRGPRKPKLNAAPSESSTSNIPGAISAPDKKRKRSLLTEDAELIKTHASSPDDADDADDADSDHYTPKATHTRSGRHTQKPSTFVPTDTYTAKKPRLAAGNSNTQGTPTPLIKKRGYKGKEQNALCELCSRGRSTVDNAIVFCDGCNFCWHQECHDPKIPKELIMDKVAQWFCQTCVAIMDQVIRDPDTGERQNLKSRVDAVNVTAEVAPPTVVQPGPSSNTITAAAVMTASESRVGARSLTLEQRQQYLTTLPRQELVDLLLRTSNIAPDLPIFPAPTPQSTPKLPSDPVSNPAPASSSTTANPSTSPIPTASTMRPPPLPPPPPPLTTSSNPNPNLNPSRAAKAAAPKYTSPPSPSSESASESDQEEEDYEEADYYRHSHSKCYPKPGQGLMSRLPPDKADEHMLLEGSESRTFSHSLKGTGTGVFGKGKGPAGDSSRALGDEDKENWIRGG